MRIIITNDFYEDIGGAGRVFKNTLRLLKSNAHMVFPFVIIGDNFSGDLSKKYSFFRKPKGQIGSFIFKHFDFRLFIHFRSFIKEVHPDLIHCQQNYNSPLSLLLAAKLERIPVIQTLHDFNLVCLSSWGTKKNYINPCFKGAKLACLNNKCLGYGDFFRNILAWYIRKAVIKRVEAIITPSTILSSAMEKNTFSNVVSIPNFVYRPKNLGSLKEKIKNRNPLFVGRLTPQKGCQYLIEAMKIVEKAFPKISLLIVGDGLERKKLEKLTTRLISSQVEFLGEIPHNEINSFYQKATILVIPSIWMENCPLVVLEAMSCGVPVVGSNIGGIPELIQEGKTGMLFKPHDSTDLADKIIYLLRHPKIAERMGKKGREMYEKYFSPEKHYQQLIKIYKEAIENYENSKRN